MPECLVCRGKETPDSTPFLRMDTCEHYWCPSCVKSRFITAASDTDSMPPNCCHFTIGLHKGLPLLDENSKDAFAAAYDEYRTDAKDGLRCPSRDCSAFISQCQVRKLRQEPEPRLALAATGAPTHISLDVTTKTSISCPECDTEICLLCKMQDHPDNDCNTDDEEVFALIRRWGYKRCPHCGIGTKRTGGCRQMVCHCGAEWCWSCEGNYSTCVRLRTCIPNFEPEPGRGLADDRTQRRVTDQRAAPQALNTGGLHEALDAHRSNLGAFPRASPRVQHRVQRRDCEEEEQGGDPATMTSILSSLLRRLEALEASYGQTVNSNEHRRNHSGIINNTRLAPPQLRRMSHVLEHPELDRSEQIQDETELEAQSYAILPNRGEQQRSLGLKIPPRQHRREYSADTETDEHSSRRRRLAPPDDYPEEPHRPTVAHLPRHHMPQRNTRQILDMARDRVHRLTRPTWLRSEAEPARPPRLQPLTPEHAALEPDGLRASPALGNQHTPQHDSSRALSRVPNRPHFASDSAVHPADEGSQDIGSFSFRYPSGLRETPQRARQQISNHLSDHCPIALPPRIPRSEPQGSRFAFEYRPARDSLRVPDPVKSRRLPRKRSASPLDHLLIPPRRCDPGPSSRRARQAANPYAPDLPRGYGSCVAGPSRPRRPPAECATSPRAQNPAQASGTPPTLDGEETAPGPPAPRDDLPENDDDCERRSDSAVEVRNTPPESDYVRFGRVLWGCKHNFRPGLEGNIYKEPEDGCNSNGAGLMYCWECWCSMPMREVHRYVNCTWCGLVRCQECVVLFTD